MRTRFTFTLFISLFLVATLGIVAVTSSAIISSENLQVSSISSIPYLRSTSENYSSHAQQVSCGLSNVRAGELLIALVTSTGVPQTSMTVKDSFSDSFKYSSNWSYNIGTGSAYIQTSGSGSVVIQATVGSPGAGLVMFCYDVKGASAANVLMSAQTGSGTKLSVPFFYIHSHSFVVASYLTLNLPVYRPGSGFSLTPANPVAGQSSNLIANEWMTPSSSSSTCPASISTSQNWGGVCFAFPPT